MGTTAEPGGKFRRRRGGGSGGEKVVLRGWGGAGRRGGVRGACWSARRGEALKIGEARALAGLAMRGTPTGDPLTCGSWLGPKGGLKDRGCTAGKGICGVMM